LVRASLVEKFTVGLFWAGSSGVEWRWKYDYVTLRCLHGSLELSGI